MLAHFITRSRRRPKTLLVTFALILIIIWEAGLDLMIMETSYSHFAYPLLVPDDVFYNAVTNFRQKLPSTIAPINTFYSSLTLSSPSEADLDCTSSFDFLILVKSAPSNFKNRDAIRSTWKEQNVPGVTTKTLFFIGVTSKHTLAPELLEESWANKDIVRLNYEDSYFNNTIKTVSELRYAAEICVNFKYAILLDDDYYLSIRNLHQFTEEVSSVERLYAGFTFFSKPLRHRFRNKWFIPLEEYPYSYFPRFVNAGNILLSKSALLDIYYATFFAQPFRFDDVYVAICAKKMGIEPLHSDRFKFWVESGDEPREELVAAHGYPPERLRMYWKVQMDAGFA